MIPFLIMMVLEGMPLLLLELSPPLLSLLQLLLLLPDLPEHLLRLHVDGESPLLLALRASRTRSLGRGEHATGSAHALDAPEGGMGEGAVSAGEGRAGVGKSPARKIQND